jgi:RNA recognition motif-containing protein
MKILIRNIPREISEQEVRHLFEAFGTIQSCTLVLDASTGKSKGFAFVEMPKPGEAKAAIKTLNGTKLNDQPIRVKKAVKKADEASEAPAEGA